jgi:hypothetical protein
MILTLRPYHILCRLGYNGYGYSPEFIAEMTRTVTILKSSRVKLIVVRPGFDNICRSCPHAEMECNPDSPGPRGRLLTELDKRTMKALRLKPGYRYPLPEIDERIAKLSEKEFEDLCSNCEWRILGTCAKEHTNLRRRFNLVS